MNTSNIEKEIKILEIDVVGLVDKIKKLNGKKILDSITTMKWFDFSENTNETAPQIYKDEKVSRIIKLASGLKSHNSFRDSEIYFRLRREERLCDLTLKYKKSEFDGIIQNQEFSHEFAQKYEKLVQQYVLESGFSIIAEHEKKRISFLLPISDKETVRVDIDQWPGIPPYVEIEATKNEQIMHAVDMLKLDVTMKSTQIGKKFFEIYGIDFFSDLHF